MNACVQQAKKNPSLNGWQAGRVEINLEQSVMEWKDQYKHPMWQKKRLEALEASEYTCQCCFDSESQLHVHHRQYFKGRKIWEYELDELEVLCDECHGFVHEDMSLLKSLLSHIPADAISDVTALIGGFVINGIGPIRESVSFVREHSEEIKNGSKPMFNLGLFAGAFARNATNEQVETAIKTVDSWFQIGIKNNAKN